MRIALCLSGFARSFNTTYKLLLNNLLLPFRPDVFIHTWDRLDRRMNKPVNLQSLQQMYEPKAMKIESYPIEFLITEKMEKSGRDNNGIMSMFYKTRACNDLKKAHELQHGFKYDCVIRCRFDLRLEQRFSPGDLSRLNIPMYGDFAGVNDQLAWGNSLVMDEYSSLFTKIYTLAEEVDFVPEFLLKRHLERCGMEVNRPALRYKLIRMDGEILDNETRERAWGLIK